MKDRAANGSFLQAVEDGLGGASAVDAGDAWIILQHIENAFERVQLNGNGES